eukprot:GHVR01135514.1.p1 GENE.GHVR01135514.1~~GHVR01135514.1.p1  ORF type:complete len:301 (-),score=52.35 GHVR01135514.1:569-1471(-)
MADRTEEQFQDDGILDMLGDDFQPEAEEEVVEEVEEEVVEEEAADDEVVEETEGDEVEEAETTDDEPEAPEADTADVETPIEPVEPPSPADDLTVANEQIANLLKIIESQSMSQLGITQTATPEQAEPQEAEATPPAPTVPKTLADIVGTVDFNDMQDDPSKFIDMLGRVVEFTKEQTRNEVQSNLSNVVSQQTNHAVNMQKMVSDFYRDNSELSEVKHTVSVVVKNVGTEHPDWDMGAVLNEAAGRTRKMLGLGPKPAQEKKTLKREGKPPAIPKQQRGKRTVAKPVTKQQQMINDLID